MFGFYHDFTDNVQIEEKRLIQVDADTLHMTLQGVSIDGLVKLSMCAEYKKVDKKAFLFLKRTQVLFKMKLQAQE